MIDRSRTSAAAAPSLTRRAPARHNRSVSGYRLGGVALALLFLGTAVLLSYTLLDLPWQQRWGGWNYVVGVALTLSISIPMRRWRPTPARTTGSITGG